jgi:hypothetical protein
MKSRAMLKFTNGLLFSKLTYFMKLLNFSFDNATTPDIARFKMYTQLRSLSKVINHNSQLKIAVNKNNNYQI